MREDSKEFEIGAQRSARDGDGILGYYRPRDKKWTAYPELWQSTAERVRGTLQSGRTHSGDGRWWQIFAHVAFILLLYVTVTFTIPIGQVAAAKRGVNSFAGAIHFPKGTSEGTLSDVASVHDSIGYSRAFLQALLTPQPVVHAPPGQHKLFFLEVNRLINSVVLVQRRVRPSDCSYPAMKPMYSECFEGLDDHEVSRGSMVLEDGRRIPYSQRLGGFAVEVPLDADATKEFDRLRKAGFWDSATREFAVRFAFHNSPGHYTANVDLRFSYSPYGRVDSVVDSQFLRFKPYSAEVNGDRFAVCQCICFAAFALFVAHYWFSIVDQPHIRWSVARLCRPWQVLELFNHLLGVLFIYLWFRYMNNPARSQMDFESSEFQDIGPLSSDFSQLVLLAAVILLLWTVRTLDFFSALGNPQLTKTNNIIEAVIANLLPFLPIFAIILIGFVLVGHILFGIHEDRFNGWPASGMTLVTWFVGLSGGHRHTIDLPGGPFFMFLFIIVAMVLLFNMFIALVMSAHDDVLNDEAGGKPSNHILADWICDQLGVSQFPGDPTALAEARDDPEPLGFAKLVQLQLEAEAHATNDLENPAWGRPLVAPIPAPVPQGRRPSSGVLETLRRNLRPSYPSTS